MLPVSSWHVVIGTVVVVVVAGTIAVARVVCCDCDPGIRRRLARNIASGPRRDQDTQAGSKCVPAGVVAAVVGTVAVVVVAGPVAVVTVVAVIAVVLVAGIVVACCCWYGCCCCCACVDVSRRTITFTLALGEPMFSFPAGCLFLIRSSRLCS